MWTLIFLAFAQADDILADEAKGKKPAATKVAEPAAVPPAAGVKSAETAGAKSPDGKISILPSNAGRSRPGTLKEMFLSEIFWIFSLPVVADALIHCIWLSRLVASTAS